jgi:hypothetical protein
MILGLSLAQFTYLHVFLSMIGIGAGLFVVFGFFTSRRLSILTSLFLVTTVMTSLTGFFYPFTGITPGIILGILSLIVLLFAIVGLYVKKLEGPWRAIYVVSAGIAYYFNVFVLVAQGFAKVPQLKSVAPTMASPAFGGAQLAVLVIFILIIVRGVKKFHPE